MIAQIVGTIISKNPPIIIIDVQGIGYEVNVPMTTFYTLGAVGESIQLYTHLSIREDAHQLFGFATLLDRNLFRELIKVNGIGPKAGLGILSGMSSANFAQAVLASDAVSLTKIPGIGKKTAERLLIEMKDKLEKIDQFKGLATGADSINPANNTIADAIGALEALGYKRTAAEKTIRRLDQSLSSEELIKAALRSL